MGLVEVGLWLFVCGYKWFFFEYFASYRDRQRSAPCLSIWFNCPELQVRLVGRMLNKNERVTNVEFVLDDGTGRIDVNRW